MELTGANYIGFEASSTGSATFNAYNPENGQQLPIDFQEASKWEVDRAAHKAETAFTEYSTKSDAERARFLEAIGDEIMALDDLLIQRCMQETALPEGRLKGERGRTVNQLRLFANLLKEGSWVNAKIDKANPDRSPVPKPDVRQMQRPLGPVGIFGASNFPLAFSVAGGDTASALAAGCTLVVKAHPAHPGTSELVGRAILKAAKATGMPDGVFSLVQGPSVDVGMAIVQHPLIQAIGFTGSFRGGKAIFDAAAKRAVPIPVYAEMGSINPVFLLPGALKENRDTLAKGFVGSLTLGVGQFCTNPGVFIGQRSDELTEFIQTSGTLVQSANAGTMLTTGIQQAYDRGRTQLAATQDVELVAEGQAGTQNAPGQAAIYTTTVENWLANENLAEEVFGPASIGLVAGDKADLLSVANKLEGHLTATIHGTEEDLKNHQDLIAILERKVGRLLINGFPTGVEVCHAMVHGGPFPATTDSRSTSVGTDAIYRFTRPVCYQNFPAFLLPDALKDDNPLQIWRVIDGKRTKD
jgi:NADP-dependent aldehyde dehydrogenase